MNSAVRKLEHKAKSRRRIRRGAGNVVKRIDTPAGPAYKLTTGAIVDDVAGAEFTNPAAPVLVMDR